MAGDRRIELRSGWFGAAPGPSPSPVVGKGGVAPPSRVHEALVLLLERLPVGWSTGVEPAPPVSQTGALPLSYDHSGSGWTRTTDLLLIRQVRHRLRHTPETPCPARDSNAHPPASHTSAHPSSSQGVSRKLRRRHAPTRPVTAVTMWVAPGVPAATVSSCAGSWDASRVDAITLQLSMCVPGAAWAVPVSNPCQATKKPPRGAAEQARVATIASDRVLPVRPCGPDVPQLKSVFDRVPATSVVGSPITATLGCMCCEWQRHCEMCLSAASSPVRKRQRPQRPERGLRPGVNMA